MSERTYRLYRNYKRKECWQKSPNALVVTSHKILRKSVHLHIDLIQQRRANPKVTAFITSWPPEDIDMLPKYLYFRVNKFYNSHTKYEWYEIEVTNAYYLPKSRQYSINGVVKQTICGLQETKAAAAARLEPEPKKPRRMIRRLDTNT